MRLWSSTTPSTKTSCRSGTLISGAEQKNAPDSAIELEIMPVRLFFHSKMARVNATVPRADTPKVCVSLRVR